MKKKWNDAMEQAQLQATTLEFRHNKLEEHEEVQICIYRSSCNQCVTWLFVKFHHSDDGESTTSNLKLRKSRPFT